MKKYLLIYGSISAALLLMLQYWEYCLLLHTLSLETYLALIGCVSIGVGIWLGRYIHTPRPGAQAVPIQQGATLHAPETSITLPTVLGGDLISKREMEVLQLMAAGCSNQEIADRLFVSLATVKKHSSSLFQKLEVKRRTQAVDTAKKLGIIA